MRKQEDTLSTNRRDFVAGVTKTFLAGTALALPWGKAAGADCTTYDGNVTASANASPAVQFWIDGVHFEARSNLPSRANVSVFLPLTQSAGSYVERVYLKARSGKVIQARLYGPNDKMADGSVPYTIFENVALDSTSLYDIGYVLRTGTTSELYVAPMNSPKRTALKESFLPAAWINDFKTFLADNSANPTPGLISTPFQYYTLNGIDTHTARARFADIGADGSFTLDFDFMHGDVNLQHFMRYFIVLDPVGRVLGFDRRTSLTPTTNHTAGLWRVTKITNQQKSDFGIPDGQVASILDCPFVRVFTDCNYDAVTEQVIRLR